MAGKVIKEERDGFDFAVAVTKKTKFEGESASEFYKNGGRVSLVYEIQGGDNDGDIFEIDMEPCLNDTFYLGHHEKRVDAKIRKHIEQK